MSYPMDLEDYELSSIVKELASRREAQLADLCSYCKKPIQGPYVCKRDYLHDVKAAPGVRYVLEYKKLALDKQLELVSEFIDAHALSGAFAEWLAKKRK